MPVLHQYKDRPDYYILTKIQGNIITFQLTGEGQRRLQEKGIRAWDNFPRALLLDLYRSGQAFTQGSGPSEIVDPRQTTIFDLPNDPDSEKMFPSCAVCNSMNDLHLVEITDGDEKVSILCADCRPIKIATFDTSIPLTLVSRTILKQIIAMKGIKKIDASVTAYKELLDAEFESKWNAYKKGKTEQGVLIEADDGKQGKLI
jgi:hypothetical protein